jgi:hypothetical protein
MQPIRAVLATATLVIGILTMTFAQTDRASALRFDTASVKPNTSATGSTIAIQGSGVRLIGVTARQLLVRAYGVESFDISGGPDWLASDRFDVIAKTPAEAKLPSRAAAIATLKAVVSSSLIRLSIWRPSRMYRVGLPSAIANVALVGIAPHRCRTHWIDRSSTRPIWIADSISNTRTGPSLRA